MPNITPIKVLKKLREFEVRPDDIFIVTYPKSGTTWVEQLVLLIRHDSDTTVFDGQHIMSRIPFLDQYVDDLKMETSPMQMDLADEMPSPRILKTHCHLPWLPKELQQDDPEAKVIYVARNPKDTAVSYYNFCNYIPLLPSYESWDVFFEEYLAGRAPQGSWFINVIPWWERRSQPNVLFLKYEDMKKDLHGAIKQIAKFMGKTLSNDVIDTIAKASTFDAMKTNKLSNPDFLFKARPVEYKGSFMRKGVVGDWRNFFTEDQNKRFDELYEKELSGTGLDFDFGPSE